MWSIVYSRVNEQSNGSKEQGSIRIRQGEVGRRLSEQANNKCFEQSPDFRKTIGICLCRK